MKTKKLQLIVTTGQPIEIGFELKPIRTAPQIDELAIDDTILIEGLGECHVYGDAASWFHSIGCVIQHEKQWYWVEELTAFTFSQMMYYHKKQKEPMKFEITE